MHAIQTQVIDPIRMHEFFLCDVPKTMREQFAPGLQDVAIYGKEQALELEKYKRVFEAKGWFQRDHFELIRDELTTGHGTGPTRFGVHLKMPEAAAFFLLANHRNRNNASSEVEGLLNRLNEDWMRRCGEYMSEARGAIEGNIRYFKIECGRSEITRRNFIVEPYFS